MEMPWRDDHKIPEPVLVLSGLTYLIPAYYAYTAGFTYTYLPTLFLTFTTVGFHGTRQQWLFELDIVAILLYNASLFHNVYRAGYPAALLWYMSMSYSLLSYFGGQHFQIASFDPDWNTQMAFHALIHVSTAYVQYFCVMKQIHI